MKLGTYDGFEGVVQVLEDQGRCRHGLAEVNFVHAPEDDYGDLVVGQAT